MTPILPLLLLVAGQAADAIGGGAAAQVAPAEMATAPSSLLVEVVSPAKFIGFPAVCPGTSPEDNQEEIVCVAELYEAKVKVLRHLGGAPSARRLTIRFTAHSFSAVWQRQTRFLIVASPFEDKGSTGHFAQYWDWENDQGKFCVEQDEFADWGDSPLARLFAGGRKRLTKIDGDRWPNGTAIVCVVGDERLVS